MPKTRSIRFYILIKPQIRIEGKVVTADKRPENYMAESADRPASSRLGAVLAKSGECEFTVWAPSAKNVEVRLIDDGRLIRLSPEAHGYHIGHASGVKSDERYIYRVDNQKDWPDPASRFQPEGVFGPSQIVDLKKAAWADQGWRGLELREYIVYELHVGTYTSAGTLDAIIGHLQELKSLGVTAIEIMPVAQFSGSRNWGYDGVFPFAVQNTYGGPLA